ncbi:MAG: Nif3-like dinuclear metal center hexameric protein [Bacteroidota bacterium]|jgi:dinuclear metal center YbgI/SA1388 family protein
MKVTELIDILNNWMPLELAEDFDNVGLIVGDHKSDISGILVTLDTTEEVVQEAIDRNCNMIVSYHPIIFNNLKKITADSNYVQNSIIKAVKNNISIYAIHTSLDNHPQGISYFLSKIIGLDNISSLISKPQKNNINSGMGSLGQLKKPMNEDVFLDYIKDKLNLKVIRYSKKLNKKISTISILVGSGSFAIKDSIEKKSDVFITSDLKYHNFFEGNNELLLVDIGHYESENHIKTIIKEFLIEKLPNFTVLLSEQNINPVNYK